MDNDTLTELAEDFAIAYLPHGSGINYNWRVKVRQKTVVFFNSYQVMGEYGNYVGTADFSITVDKENFVNSNWERIAQDFCLHFHGKHSHYLNRYYELREYLENEFHFALSL